MDKKEVKKAEYRYSAKNYRKQEHTETHSFLLGYQIYNRNPIMAFLGF